MYEGIIGKWNSHTSSWTHLQKELPYQKFRFRDYLFSKLFRKDFPKDCSARIDIGQMHSPILLLEVPLMKYGMLRQQLMILSHIIKDTTLHLKNIMKQVTC